MVQELFFNVAKSLLPARPFIAMLVAPPGSGKSTFRKTLMKHRSFRCKCIEGCMAFVSGDTIREDLYGDENIQGDWMRDIEPVMRYEIFKNIRKNKTVIVDNTNCVSKVRKVREEWAKELGCPLVYIKIHAGLANCLKWNAERDRKVPEEVIYKMHSGFTAFTESEYPIINVINDGKEFYIER